MDARYVGPLDDSIGRTQVHLRNFPMLTGRCCFLCRKNPRRLNDLKLGAKVTFGRLFLSCSCVIPAKFMLIIMGCGDERGELLNWEKY